MHAKALQALIFDCDGVLADTERDAHRVAFNLAFEENELNTVWSESRYGKLLEVGGGKERMTAHFNEVGWPEGYTTGESQQELVKKLHLRKTELFGKLISEGKIPLRPGVQSLADSASKKGLPIAVCSTSNEKAVAQIVTMMGPQLASSIEIFAGDIVPKKKPSPDIYNLATEKLNLDPAATVVIEDSYIGLQAAKDAGMNCIVTKVGLTTSSRAFLFIVIWTNLLSACTVSGQSTYTVDEDFARADRVVDDLDSGAVTLESLEALVSNE
eukprot:CAMPEP_0113967202 /NCGR_PEP_ID=MMETSP0011_2-20120614/8786_1 /TAXON_ID=101924 /ORGANISM="Rhodosorus marinus" /LENGTH=269 /DNA_ID=CAMNT_0000980033 /DNA_START=114 /DNA_END=923 /DNA_ORIENTATION=- /assembly_acc=CAM_ASM_000156